MVSEKDGDEDFEPVEIFREDGSLSAEMLALIGLSEDETGDDTVTADENAGIAHLIGRLESLADQRKHEQSLSRSDHPQALHISVAGENRVNRQIANLLPEIMEALRGI